MTTRNLAKAIFGLLFLEAAFCTDFSLNMIDKPQLNFGGWVFFGIGVATIVYYFASGMLLWQYLHKNTINNRKLEWLYLSGFAPVVFYAAVFLT